jgi:hypothetical protein
MPTLDLAHELDRGRVTANCLHPGTYMPTKMVLDAGIAPVDSLEAGVRATMRLIADADLDAVTGALLRRAAGVARDRRLTTARHGGCCASRASG